MMDGSHRQHTLSFRQRGASNFVGASQCFFTADQEVVRKSPGIGAFQIAGLAVLKDFVHSRQLSPWYRATNTRASSVALPYRARIFSAAFRGGKLRANPRA